MRLFERTPDTGPDRRSELGRAGEQLPETFCGAVTEGADHGGHTSFAENSEGHPADAVGFVRRLTRSELVRDPVEPPSHSARRAR